MATAFLEIFATGFIGANCILLGDAKTKTGVVIDPGGDAELIDGRIAASGLQVEAVWLTHGHIDHIGGLAGLIERRGEMPILLHPADRQIYDALPEQARMFGLDSGPAPTPTGELAHGQELRIGGLRIEVRHAPGHSPGSVIFVVHDADRPLAIVGDVIFAGSIGRTDLWGGSFDQLKRSIQDQVYTLSPDTRLIVGHGEATSVSGEAMSNPFVRPAASSSLGALV